METRRHPAFPIWTRSRASRAQKSFRAPSFSSAPLALARLERVVNFLCGYCFVLKHEGHKKVELKDCITAAQKIPAEKTLLRLIELSDDRIKLEKEKRANLHALLSDVRDADLQHELNAVLDQVDQLEQDRGNRFDRPASPVEEPIQPRHHEGADVDGDVKIELRAKELASPLTVRTIRSLSNADLDLALKLRGIPAVGNVTERRNKLRECDKEN